MTNKVWISLNKDFTDKNGTIFNKGCEVQGVREKAGVRIAAGIASGKENFIPWSEINETYLIPKEA